jgi:hypothetical protein
MTLSFFIFQLFNSISMFIPAPQNMGDNLKLKIEIILHNVNLLLLFISAFMTNNLTIKTTPRQ